MKVQLNSLRQNTYRLNLNQVREQEANKNGNNIPYNENMVRNSEMKAVSVPISAVSFGVQSLRPAKNMTRISFGNAETKKPNQILQMPSELNGLMNSVYNEGGLAVVAKEATLSWQNPKETPNTNIEVKTILPYHSFSEDVKDPENKGVLVLTKDQKGVMLNEKNTILKEGSITGNQKEVLKRVPVDYQLKSNEMFVISDGKNFKEIERLDNYKGTIKSLDKDTFDMKEVPYQLFRLKSTDKTKNVNRGDIYFMHTPEAAQLPKAYGGPQCSSSGSGGWTGETGAHFLDHDYGDYSKAVVDVLPKMKDEGFEPANIWIHDRFGMAAITDMANRGEKDDYFEGLRVHSTFHNVGAAYQGKYSNPIDFFSIMADEKDYEKLKQADGGKSLKFVKAMAQKMTDLGMENVQNTNPNPNFDPYKALAKEEREALDKIFAPYIGMFKDDNGDYNVSAIAITAAEKQNNSFSAGTVSLNYGNESRNPLTPEMSEGLQKRFLKAKDKLIDITNGSAAASLETDKPYVKGKFGFPDSGLGSAEGKTKMVDYKPYSAKNTADELYEIKQFNKNIFYDSITNSKPNKSPVDISQDSINRLFLAESQITGNTQSKVYGYIENKRAELNGKDPIIMFGLGRGDDQKGFPVSLAGFKKFLEDPAVNDVDKKRVNLILVGDGLYKCKRDTNLVQNYLQDINKIDGGKYKNQAIFIDGRCSNKYVCCSDFAYLTSRFEPCGITPIESKICGTPVLSTNTGGAPNLIEEGKTGFLTKNAFMIGGKELLPADKQNLTGQALKEAIDDARIEKQSVELGEVLKKAVKTYDDKETYKKMAKACIDDKGEWFNNASANNGIAANDKYFRDVWQIDKNNNFQALPGRTKERLHPLVGDNFGSVAEDVYKKVVKGGKSQGPKISRPISDPKGSDPKGINKWLKIGGWTAAGIAGVAGIGALGMYFVNKNKVENTQDTV